MGVITDTVSKVHPKGHKKVCIGWREFETLVRRLARKVPKEKVKSIYAVPRGGYPAACLMAHLLNLPIVQKPEGDSLVVDDIEDSGRTLSEYSGMKAVPISKIKNTKTLCAAIVPVSEWIVFPWEAGGVKSQP
ncbi:hypothetical protein COV61_01620 [Candidatus Micrarchaeota archaeon CG11_big_fil_rev_8_21_14_0_20_47_5]|nr:MAG: hypothetical protein AUJ17_05785 [Candidatus Micrarchaeota archaeon CG1_02_47_40]PIN83939.1 MAG: hypothetical protein COV61_01620 [Candidatus Micrarchaeota archaeon CG11_big_fil_rev_8_21_14_0_20_47_5]